MAVRYDRPPVRVILDRNEAEEFCQELMEIDIAGVDSEWINHDNNKHPYNNGNSFCWTFCYRAVNTSDLQLVFLYNYGQSEGLHHCLTEYWRSPKHIKILSNAPSDWHILANDGVVAGGFVYDTIVMDHLLDENRENKHGLKECVYDFLGVDRKSFAETFGTPKMTLKGVPYASGQRDVPTLQEWVAEGDQNKWDILIEYACDDAWDAYTLYEQVYRPKLESIPWMNGKSLWDYYCAVDSPITEVICRMERRGMPVDIPFMREMAAICEADLNEMEAKALEWAGCPMNIASGKQLGMLLHGYGNQEVKKNKNSKRVEFYIPGRGWPVFKATETGLPSTSADDLKDLRNRLGRGYTDPRTKRIVKVPKEELEGFDYILTHKRLEKQKNTYLVETPNKAVGGRFRERINQIGTTSGRFSMSSMMLMPTGQKDMYHIRDGFHASPGKLLIVADWKNLEYRLLAHFSQDPTLIDIFNKNLDMHSMTAYKNVSKIKQEVDERFGGPTKEALDWIAEEFPDDRKDNKTLNFEIIYGVGHKKLAEQLDKTHDEAKAMIRGWFKAYPYVEVFNTRLINEFRQQGFSLLLDGRPRHADMSRLMLREESYMSDEEKKKVWFIRGEEERTLKNAKIQGSAAAMAKRAMIRIEENQELKELGYTQLLQVHDELIGECPIENCDQAAEIIRPIMETPFSRPLRLAMPVSIGKGVTWETAKT